MNIMMKKGLVLIAGLLSLADVSGQVTFPENGAADPRERRVLLRDGIIHKSAGDVCDRCDLLIEKGRVKAIGRQIAVPPGTEVRELQGMHVYPSFIEIYTDTGLPPAKAEGEQPRQLPQMLSNKSGAYAWNEALKTEYTSGQQYKPDARQNEALRKLGFGTVVSHRMDGISRGVSVAATLGDERAHDAIVKQQAAHHFSFNKGTSTQSYPSSLMGGIALIRQTYHDGRWYAATGYKEEVNLSLEAWNRMQSLPQVFEVRDKLELLRAAAIGKEFGVQYIIKGGGDEYQRLEAVRQTGCPVILPLNFPDAYDVEDPYDAQQVTLTSLMHWEWAARNPGILAGAGIPIVFTTNGLRQQTELFARIRTAMEQGLKEEDALKALTETPARLLRLDDQLGSLAPGKRANFLVVTGPVFAEQSRITENWVQGRPYSIQEYSILPWEGSYQLAFEDRLIDLTVTRRDGKTRITGRTAQDTTTIRIELSQSGNKALLQFALPPDSSALYRLSGYLGEDSWSGQGETPSGRWFDWTARMLQKADTEEVAVRAAAVPASEPVAAMRYPFTGYGWKSLPAAGTWLIRNATVWTNTGAGRLDSADVLIADGRIRQVGKGLRDRNATEIDATGLHLTPGIIDEHSHIAISRGVNEGAQASSAEVRIGDVINSEDVNIYRHLAGGVTAVQLLHGSANPVGGQSALIKLRWGALPEELRWKGADGFIKFALGENVKQSNFGDRNNTRFPQSRMGVEQVFEDLFTMAAEYEAIRRSGKPYRVDLDLEAILEILQKKRFITCHSYVQSEINMLMKLAERHGFRVNTFTHILEGYKVADKMHVHGAGASTFSDWWAYKMEVKDAIPYNAAMLNREGVVTAINSDDAEMGRRLNQEAAKAVKYGGLSEEEALKLVTLYPAQLLHIDHEVGSIEAGKHADLVIWSDNPLSVYARAEHTFVDGKLLYDRKTDEALQSEIREDRARIIGKMIQAKKGGARTQAVRSQRERHYHCDDMLDEMGSGE